MPVIKARSSHLSPRSDDWRKASTIAYEIISKFHRLIMLAPVILQGDFDEALFSEGLDHFRLNMIGRHEQQETAAARAAEFAAISAETHRFVVGRVDLRQGDGG